MKNNRNENDPAMGEVYAGPWDIESQKRPMGTVYAGPENFNRPANGPTFMGEKKYPQNFQTPAKKNQKEDKAVFCPICGAKNTVKTRFCAECGTPLNPKEE